MQEKKPATTGREQSWVLLTVKRQRPSWLEVAQSQLELCPGSGGGVNAELNDDDIADVRWKMQMQMDANSNKNVIVGDE